MPHEPGHRYFIRETGEEYIGRTVSRGNKLYTTTGNTYEGQFSRELVEHNDNVVSQTNQQTSTSNDTDVVTQFIVGEVRGNKFYHSTFSNQNYYYSNGNIVASGTRLHHHTIPPNGRSNFMTQHTMDGNDVDVTPTRPSRRRTSPRGTRQLSRANNQRLRAMRTGRMGVTTTTNQNGMSRSNGAQRRQTSMSRTTPSRQTTGGTRTTPSRRMTRGTRTTPSRRMTRRRTGGY